MASIYVKWNEGEGSVQVPVGYHGHREEIATAVKHNGYVVATMNDASETFSSETMKGLKQQILEHYHNQQNEMVDVTFINPHSGKESTASITRGQRGTACDPSMDSYWTM